MSFQEAPKLFRTTAELLRVREDDPDLGEASPDRTERFPDVPASVLDGAEGFRRHPEPLPGHLQEGSDDPKVLGDDSEPFPDDPGIIPNRPEVLPDRPEAFDGRPEVIPDG